MKVNVWQRVQSYLFPKNAVNVAAKMAAEHRMPPFREVRQTYTVGRDLLIHSSYREYEYYFVNGLSALNKLTREAYAIISGERRDFKIDLSKVVILKDRKGNPLLPLIFSKQRAISALVKSIFTPVKILHDSLHPRRAAA